MKKIIPISIAALVLIAAALTIYFVSNNKKGNSENAISTATFNCNNGKNIHAIFFDEKVELTLSDGRSMLIPQAISASGARYANQDESFVFWNKGDTAFIQENNNTTFDNCSTTQTSSQQNTQVVYENTEYNFSVVLPDGWKNYSIMNDKWSGNYTNSTEVEQGPLVNVRHPEWTNDNPRQDIPVMVFTLDQWNKLEADKFHIGAAPINPKELARNDKYIFALPARYNFAFLTGYEEVDTIINNGAVVDSAWLKVKSAIEACNVKEVMQAHSKQVSAELKDGTKINAYELNIDDIMNFTTSFKNKCGDVIMATE